MHASYIQQLQLTHIAFFEYGVSNLPYFSIKIITAERHQFLTDLGTKLNIPLHALYYITFTILYNLNELH